MRAIAVFDIDGVLADVRHRLHHVEASPKRWSAFFAEADRDGLLAEGAAILRSLAEDHEIRYLTGRPERMRALTELWLVEQSLPTASLTMRPNRDRRPSRLFKRDRLRQWQGESAPIALVVDDDPQVIEMVAQLGLAVLAATWQDAPTDEQQVLWDVQELLGRS